jgi:hypothetical protein
MSNGASGGGQNPPSWWSVDLYSFVNDDFPLNGWVWEFMRRARLQEVLGDRPVDAMNPKPDLDSIKPNYWDLYKPWNHSKWSHKSPIFLPPAVALPGEWPKGFAGQRHRIGDKDLKQFVEMTIDINRIDSVIIRDFKAILKDLRIENPAPQPIRPNTKAWASSHILEVWDLRQYQLYWVKIAESVGVELLEEDKEGAIQFVRNAFNIAHRHIEGGEWLNLARYTERA